MKNSLLCLILLTASSHSSALANSLALGMQTAARGDNYTLKVQFQNSPTHRDDVRQTFTVVLTNTSGTDLKILRTNPLHDYDILVTDTQGAQVPMTDHGKQPLEGQNEIFTHVAPVTIKPQDSIKTVVNLHDYYELEPGQYVVQVRRHVKAGSKNASSRANAAPSTEGQSWASSPLTIVP